eukprot:9697-Heterococcus_DN1.PRE.5
MAEDMTLFAMVNMYGCPAVLLRCCTVCVSAFTNMYYLNAVQQKLTRVSSVHCNCDSHILLSHQAAYYMSMYCLQLHCASQV